MQNTSAPSLIKPYELNENIGRLLPSQNEFIFAPERFSMIAGGYGSGKSRALIIKGLILSAAIPGNAGMFLCYRGTDLETRLVPLFDECCPKSWIKHATKKPFRTYTLRNGSVITFQHLHDAHSSTKSGRIGANLGWASIDQAEEILVEHWDTMASRLRLPRAPKKFLFGSLNPAGRDWIWERFFQSVRPWPRDKDGKVTHLENGKFYQVLRPKPDHVGLAVNSEENRVSNGGFITDDYFDSLLNTYGQEYVDRYVHCSFDDFKGKLFPDFEPGMNDDSISSVHNIEPFPIPRNWDCIGGIDVGGESPWAVTPCYADEYGNLIVTDGFHHRTGRVSEVANWIKSKMPWNENRTTFVIDWENKVASVELADSGIYANVANKDVNPGILRLEGYLHVRKNKPLPPWFEETQPASKFAKFRERGAPKMFVFKNATTVRKELGLAKWDPNKPDKMYKSSTARFDSCFAAGTPVLTEEGYQNIEDITVGTKVWTRQGLKRVVAACCTDSNSVLLDVKLSNGTSIKCTPNHRFMADGVFTPIDAVRYGGILETWQTNVLTDQSNSSTEYGSPCTRVNSTSESTLRENVSGCTDTSGSSTTGLFHRAIKSITRIKTVAITRLKTLPVLLQKNTKYTTSKISAISSLNQLRGIVLRMVEKLRLRPAMQPIDAEEIRNFLVCNAESLTSLGLSTGLEDTRNFAAAIASLNTADSPELMTSIAPVPSVPQSFESIDTPVLLPVVADVTLSSLSLVEDRLPVYNIMVEDAHEYYVAGVLVKNCEALRYVVMSRPQPSDAAVPDDKFLEMEKKDPGAAREWRAWDARLRARMLNQKGDRALAEMDSEETEVIGDGNRLGKYDMDAKDEF